MPIGGSPSKRHNFKRNRDGTFKNTMPAKRKRNSSYRKPYRRKRSSGRSMAGLFSDIAPRGPGSANYSKYGPSRRQMSDLGVGRSMAQSRARYGDSYRGDGNYFDDVNWKDVGRNVGHWGSRIVGGGASALAASELGPMGMIPAGMAGWNAGAEFSKAQGWGNYNVPRGSNDLINGGGMSGNGSAPIYHSSSAVDEMGDVIISNRELVQLVKTSSTEKGFNIQQFDLNPIDSTFHHLRNQAKQYEQFEFVGLMFQYIPMTGEGGSNSLGVVGMACSYDPGSSRTFVSMEDLMRFKGATTCKPSVGMVYGVECDPSKRPIKTMFTRDEVTRDKSFTDPATFYLATDGVSGTETTVGQLWVTYSIKLKNIKPYSEEAKVDYLAGMHHPAPARDSAAWLSVPSDFKGPTPFVGSNSIIKAFDTGSNLKARLLFKDLKVGQIFDCTYITVSYSNASGMSAVNKSGSGIEFIDIPTHSDDYTANEFHVEGTNKGLLYFRFKITGENAYLDLDRTDADNPQIYSTLSIVHSDKTVHVVDTSVKHLLIR